jgi:hypothetical protein
MSVAEIIHRPCPDMPFHSLNAAQKAQGLVNLSRVRFQLRERQLAPLRAKRNELSELASTAQTPHERARLVRQIKQIDEQAELISNRWS